MSETLSQDPDGLGVAYTNLSQTYPPTPATPSSTVQDGAPPGANLPPFSTFASDMDSNTGFGSVSDRLFSDTRLLDISNWDYYTETRLLERGENGLSIITSQPQYRPWESKPGADASTSTYPGTTPINTLADAFSQQNGASKLPSFQSQFQTFSDQATTTEPTTLTTLTNLTPVSPNSSSPQSLTTLNSNFHTLSAVNVNRSYPLVPAPIQAREIPSIQQQFLDERHIQLYSHPPANIALNNTLHPTFLNGQNGTLIQNNQLISSPTVVTVLKSEPDIKLSSNLAALHQDSLKIQNVGLHPTQFQNPMTQLHNSDSGLYNGIEKKMNGNMTSPTRNDFRKKERRKMRASSLESSVDSDGASSNMDLGSENSGQVAAISSTAGFKTHQMQVNSSIDMDTDISGGSVDKQVKKKRKRCGECIGCQRKDNCGDCAPCRNDKSHQICKQRRCEKLTEKKNLYQDGFLRGESRRGRGKGRGGASYRGRKPSAGVSNPLSAGNLPPEAGATVIPSGAQPSSRPSPQPTQSVPQPMPVQQQPMTPMPFYADPNRFPTPVWQTDPTQGWPQGQFIQQIPTAGQPIEAYQQYPNGIYQTTYQQPAFETNTFYTGAVQVLTNPRPPSNPNQQVQQQQQLAPPRPNSSNYSHTPSPSPAQTQQQQNAQTQAQGAANRQYQEYGQQQQNFIPPATTPTGTETSGNNSRPGSVNMNPPTPNQNYQQQSAQPQTPQTPQQQQQNFTAITNFSPNSQASYQNSGNGQPGYPQVNSSSPQLASHSSSGYPGQEQFGGQHEQQWHDEQVMWEQQHQQQQQIKIEQDYNNQSQSNAYMQQDVNNSPTKLDSMHSEVKTFSQADKVNLNTRIKTMILNKQQENKMEESKNVDQNTTGHFLWYSHHHHLKENLSVDGGSFKQKNDTDKQQQILERHKTENYDLKQACDPVNYSSGCWKSSNNFRHEQIAQNYTKTNLQQTTAQHYPVDLQQTPSRHCQNVPNANYNQLRASQHEPIHYNVSSPNSVFRQPQNVHYRRDQKNAQTSQERQSPVLLDYTSPSRRNGQRANYPRFQVNGTQISPQQIQSPNFKHEQLSYSKCQENARPTPLASNLIYPSNQADISFAQSFNSDYPLQQEIKQEKRCSSISENRPPSDQTFDRRLMESAVPLPIKQEFPPSFDPNQQTCENFNANTTPASNAKPVPNCSPYNSPSSYSVSAMDLSQYKSSKGNLQGVQRDQQPNKAAVINNSNNNLPHNENQYRSPKVMHSTPIQMKGISFEEQEQDSPIFGEKPNMEIPNCKCFSPPKTSTEEGVYYTHLGCANSLKNLRYDFECRTGVVGNAIRIEKVRYTGKEGKTAQGCPIAKWIIRRQNNDEKYLVIVKHRKGHVCHSAFIVICIVAWEGVERGGADELYSLITEKLNKFGVPTKRRCATNEPRTCACQGVDSDTCGASFSFGCSWSMFFNGCKFARSKEARKFRLTEKKEEKQLEEKMQKLANHLSPVYKCLAPKSFSNQIVNEEIASDCRLGDVPGRPFSGVTACMDFCAHAHKDTHNMINGCTVVVTLTKHRDLSKAPDEQLHVLPMYVADDTDEFGSREEQEKKVINGGIEILEKYPSEVRTCSVPASTCQKRGRKPKEDKQVKRKLSFLSSPSSSNSFSSSSNDKYTSSNEIQNGHVSSTVLDYPNKSINWKYDNYQPSSFNSHSFHHNPSHGNVLPQFSVFKTPLSPDCYYGNDYSTKYYNPNYHYFTPNLMSTPHLSSYAAQFSSYPSYQINNPFDDLYTNNTLHSLEYGPPQLPNPPGKFIDISYTDNIECFRDKDIGGVAIALSHGSVLFECAKHEIHATTAIKKPNRLSPTRISLVFYQHKSLNASQHGLNEYVKKMKRKSEENGQELEKSDGDTKIEYSSVLVEKKDVMLRAPTLPTVTVTTLFPMYPCIVTGPFQEQ